MPRPRKKKRAAKFQDYDRLERMYIEGEMTLRDLSAEGGFPDGPPLNNLNRTAHYRKWEEKRKEWRIQHGYIPEQEKVERQTAIAIEKALEEERSGDYTYNTLHMVDGSLARIYYDDLQDCARIAFMAVVTRETGLSMLPEIGLLSARIATLNKSHGAIASGPLWKALQLDVQLLVQARRDDNAAAMAKHLNGIIRKVERGGDAAGVYDEMVSAIEQKRRTVETEVKRIKEMQQFANVDAVLDKVWVFLDQAVQIIKARVEDENVFAAIAEDFNTLAEGLQGEFKEAA